MVMTRTDAVNKKICEVSFSRVGLTLECATLSAMLQTKYKCTCNTVTAAAFEVICDGCTLNELHQRVAIALNAAVDLLREPA